MESATPPFACHINLHKVNIPILSIFADRRVFKQEEQTQRQSEKLLDPLWCGEREICKVAGALNWKSPRTRLPPPPTPPPSPLPTLLSLSPSLIHHLRDLAQGGQSQLRCCLAMLAAEPNSWRRRSLAGGRAKAKAKRKAQSERRKAKAKRKTQIVAADRRRSTDTETTETATVARIGRAHIARVTAREQSAREREREELKIFGAQNESKNCFTLWFVCVCFCLCFFCFCFCFCFRCVKLLL